jgi:DnaJ-class molecular chaperone
MHGWQIHREGGTWGVLASFYTPVQATEFIQNYKQKIALAKKESDEIRSAFSLLGLDENCSREQFVLEYRKKAFSCHPDINANNPDAQRQFNEITSAVGQIREVKGWQ